MYSLGHMLFYGIKMGILMGIDKNNIYPKKGTLVYRNI